MPWQVVTVQDNKHAHDYYYVLHYILDMDWCHLVPMEAKTQFGGESGSVLIKGSRFSALLSVSHLACKCNCRFNQLENKREEFTFLLGRRIQRERITR